MAETEFDIRAAQVAHQEWWHFGCQYYDWASGQVKQAAGNHGLLGREGDDKFRHRVWHYWKFGVSPDDETWEQYKDTALYPWSAAFISYCMRTAGAGARFPYHVGHHHYVSQAVRNREAGDTDDTIVAYGRDEVAPKVGDLVWYGVDNGTVDASDWQYDDLRDFVQNNGGSFSSHCDLVVEVNRPQGHIQVIGGNIEDTVLKVRWRIDGDGKLSETRYPVVVRNNITEAAIV